MGFSEHDLMRASLRQASVKRTRPAGREIARDGRLTMQVDPAFFHNAILQNGRECWDDPEFCRDMARIDPNILVDFDGKPMVGGCGVRGKVRTRVGVASERWVYNKKGKRRVA
jgi:hypothetical protein